MTIQDNDPVALTYGQLTDEVERIEQIPTLSGAGAPTTTTPAFYPGQGYLDTTNNKLYFCTEIDETNGYTWVEKGEKYTAGTNVQISANNEISATDTTYSDFTGTDGTAAGTAGLVPAPATTDAGKYLKADGSWGEVQAGPTVVQTTGTSQTDVMSQDAVTNCLYGKNNQGTPFKSSIIIGPDTYQGSFLEGTHLGKIDTSRMGTYSIAIGDGSNSEPPKLSNINYRQIAIGGGTTVSHDSSIALGFQATTSRGLELSIGNPSKTRYIANVTDPTNAQDAATKNYVDTAISPITNTQYNNLWSNA